MLFSSVESAARDDIYDMMSTRSRFVNVGLGHWLWQPRSGPSVQKLHVIVKSGVISTSTVKLSCVA